MKPGMTIESSERVAVNTLDYATRSKTQAGPAGCLMLMGLSAGATALTVLSGFIGFYSIQEPFYQWGNRTDRLVYWYLLPTCVLGWLAFLVFVGVLVKRKALPQVTLIIALWSLWPIWWMYQSLGTYLIDNGVSLPFYR